MSYLNEEEMKQMGFRSLGKNVRLSAKASFYNCANISIGDNVRIDDFCILSPGKGGIVIGRHVHIGAYSSLIGAGRIIFEDFSGTSSRVSVYSSNDDYSGQWMTNPTVPAQFTQVTHDEVYVGRHVIIGAGSVILPGTILEEGVAVGALSLVTKRCESFGVYFGRPARKISERKRALLDLEMHV